MTDKYTRTFADFNNHPWPGKMLPEYFEYRRDAGDGNMGMQAMIQGAMSAYGPYHVIEGVEYVSPGVPTEWTGSVGFVMYSGLIRSVPAASGDLSAAGSYLIYNADSTFDVTGDKPTGVILAHNIGGTVYTSRSRWDINSKYYLPNDLTVYGTTSILDDLTVSGIINLTGDIDTYGDITGHLYNISGYESISANTGQFAYISGHSNIIIDSSFDLRDNYDIKGVTQLTGSLVRVNTANGLTIGSNKPSTAQWGYLVTMNQNVHSDGDPTFDTLTLDAAGLTVGSHTPSDGEWSYVAGMQAVGTSNSPTFVGLTLSADIVTSSTVDGVDLRNHTHASAGQNGGTVSHTELSNKGSNAHTTIDTHLGSSSNPHSVGLTQAFNIDKIIAEANSVANAFVIGNGTDTLTIHGDGGNIHITSSGEIIFAGNGEYGAYRLHFWSAQTPSPEHPRLWSDSGIVRFYDGSSYDDVYGDFFDQSSSIAKNTLEKIKNIAEIDGKVDYDSMPSEIKIVEDEQGTKLTDVGNMMYYNLSAIKEMIEKIETLEARIIQLEGG